MVDSELKINKIKNMDVDIKVDHLKIIDSIKNTFNIKSSKQKVENQPVIEKTEEKKEEYVLNENESFWNELFIKINKEIEEAKDNE